MTSLRDFRHRPSSVSTTPNGASPTPIGAAVRAPGAKILGQLDKQTNQQAGPTSFSDPPDEIFETNNFIAEAIPGPLKVVW